MRCSRTIALGIVFLVSTHVAAQETRVAAVPNGNKAVSEGGEQENFYLRPGDIVVVP
jgi:hypothetical protein